MSVSYCSVCDSEDCRCLSPWGMMVHPPGPTAAVESLDERLARIEATVAVLSRRVLRPEHRKTA